MMIRFLSSFWATKKNENITIISYDDNQARQRHIACVMLFFQSKYIDIYRVSERPLSHNMKKKQK